ncbi:MAG: hypothetical protein U5K84_04000 [Alkalibacterium sp.]|nr:hypothetical protein [Alkalibacterium sp.]
MQQKKEGMDVTVKNIIQYCKDTDHGIYGFEYTGYLKVIEDIAQLLSGQYGYAE